MGAPADATYIVEDPNSVLTGEKVTGTDLILTPFDYIVWASGGTVFAQNGKTGKIDSSGPDSATVVQFAINNLPLNVGGVVVLQQNVLSSNGTIEINKSDVTLVCFKNNKKDFSAPYFRKLFIGNNAGADVRRVSVIGLQFDECEVYAAGPPNGKDVENISIAQCQFNNYGQTDRQGIRFTGPGDIENVLIEFCGVRVRAHNTWFVSYEASSSANGHIKFDRCLFDNIAGFTGVDNIVYRLGPRGQFGHTATGLVFDSCSFVHLSSTTDITSSSVGNPTTITTATAHGLVTGQPVTISGHTGSTPNLNGSWIATVTGSTTFTIPVNVTVGGSGGKVKGTPSSTKVVRLKGGGQDAGPTQLVLNNCHFELQEASADFLVIDNNSGGVFCSIFVVNPCITIESAFAYRWVVNSHTGFFFFGSCLSIIGGRQSNDSEAVWSLGSPPQSGNFRIIISDFIGFNPQGAAAVVLPPVGPLNYTNVDGVHESLYIRGTISSVVKNGITLFTSTPATVSLAPGELVTVAYPGPQLPVVTKDRK